MFKKVIRDLFVEEGFTFTANEKSIWVTPSDDPNESIERVFSRGKKFGIIINMVRNRIDFDNCIVDQEKFNSFNWEEDNPFFMPVWGTFKRSFPFDLVKPEHFKPAIERGIKEAREKFDAIVYSKDAPTFINTIATSLDPNLCLEDDRGDLLTCATEVLDHLCYAASTPELVEINEWAVSSIFELYSYFNYNMDSYNRTMEAIKNYENPTPEEKRIIDNIIRNYKFSGVLLSPEEQKVLKEIREETALAQIKFRDNVMKEQEKPIITTTELSILDGIPESDVLRFAETGKRLGKKDCFVITGTRNDVRAVLENATNESLRRDVFLSIPNNLTGENSNVELIKTITNNRLKTARMFGYLCPADRVLEKRMVKNKENVLSFLGQLRDKYLPKAIQERDEILALIKEEKGGDYVPGRWDIPFYREKLLKRKTDVDKKDLTGFFCLTNVKYGIFNLASQLYNLKFILTGCSTWGENIEVYKVVDSTTKKYMGLLYLDFFNKPGKKPGAWCGHLTPQYQSAWEGLHDHRPHVFIVTNFSRSVEGTISFDDVTTLLHEFGHALHSLLSECKYASQSGTNVDHDLVELPSQIMENFAFEKEFLDTVAFNLSGSKLPMPILEKLREREQLVSGYNCIRQLRFGYLDMAYATLTEEFNQDVAEFETSVLKDIDELSILGDAGIHSAVFNHIFIGGYNSGYYSYKWAEMLDADAFEVFSSTGSAINPEVATKFRECILSKGDTIDAMEEYINFRGSEPKLDALLKRDGISV